jgi:hypothetical protein
MERWWRIVVGNVAMIISVVFGSSLYFCFVASNLNEETGNDEAVDRILEL